MKRETPAATLDAEAVPLVIDERVRDAADKLAADQSEAALAILRPLLDDPAVGLQARFVTAMTAWRVGRLDSAVQLLQQCHDEAPMEGTIAEALASLYAQVGNLREALFIGKIATALGGHSNLVELMPGDFPGFDWTFLNIKGDPLLGRAKLSLAAGKFQQGLDRVRQHVALYPAARDARLLYGSLLLDAGAAGLAVDALCQIEGEADLTPSFHSLYGRALTAVGAADAGRHHHDKAATAAPDDAYLAAARVADALWTEPSTEKRTAMAADWAARFGAPRKQPAWSHPRGKLVIGYLASACCDPRDVAAVAAVARAHDRAAVSVMGYGRGALSWEANAAFSGAFDKWQEIDTLDPATLARFLGRDGVHVLIDAGGFAAPRSLLALTRLRSVVRVGWLGNPGELGQPAYDTRIVACSGHVHANERAWRIPGGYPVPVATRAPSVVRTGGIAFGADVGMAQLDDETVRVWSAVLRLKPSAKLLLRANDMGPGGNVDRLIARFGRELAARIDIVDADLAKSFYCQIDVALAPRRGASARAAAEALGCGVPTVAFDGASAGEPYGALLRDVGLGNLLVASDEREYVGIAGRLADGGQARDRLALALASAGTAALPDADRFARDIETYSASVLAEAAAT